MRFVQAGFLLLGVPAYVGILAIVMQLHSPEGSLWILPIVAVWNLLLLVATVLAIVDGVWKVRARRARQLGTGALLSKLVGIPFFVTNYAVLAVTAAAGLVVPGIGLVIEPIVLIGIGLTYVTMLSTSVYAWATITQLRRERMIGTPLTVLYVLMTFVFVVDIAAGVLLFGHSRRRPRLALVWLLLALGIMMILVGAVDFFTGVLEVVFPVLGFYQLDWLLWAGPVAIGGLVVLVTALVSVVRRSVLRTEAQQAAFVRETTTVSDTSDGVLVA